MQLRDMTHRWFHRLRRPRRQSVGLIVEIEWGWIERAQSRSLFMLLFRKLEDISPTVISSFLITCAHTSFLAIDEFNLDVLSLLFEPVHEQLYFYLALYILAELSWNNFFYPD